MDITAKELAANISELATFPDVALRISDAIADEHSEIKDIGAIVEADPALSAALLRIANSPIYSVGGTVASVEKAVLVVGFRELRDLTFGICATRSFEGVPNELVSVEDFWKHSLYCASAAQCVAKHANLCHGESLFTMGLLHDIGQLAMFNQYPELAREALSISLEEDEGLCPFKAEKTVFGFDHTDVGIELAKLWKFPPSLVAAIGGHHQPYDQEAVTDAAIVVHAANSVAVMAELDSDNLIEIPPIDPRAMEHLNLDDIAMLEMAGLVKAEVADLLKLFIPK